jgi:hypothetical protein
LAGYGLEERQAPVESEAPVRCVGFSVNARPRRQASDEYNVLWMRNRRRAKPDRVQNAKDDSVGANGETESNNADRGETAVYHETVEAPRQRS